MRASGTAGVAVAVADVDSDRARSRRSRWAAWGVPQDAEAAAVHLASPASSYMTGQSLVLDGGVTVRGPFPD